MKLEIGLTAGVYNLLTLLNINQAIPLEDSRMVDKDEALDGTAWFNILGKKKIRLELGFEEIEREVALSKLQTLMQYSIPDYALPVFVKFTSARLETVNYTYTEYVEYEGLAILELVSKGISKQATTLRDFNLKIYAL